MINLDEGSKKFLLSILERHRPDMIDKTFDENFSDYSKEYYLELASVITDEFLFSGFKEDSEPNEYGLRCEALTDEILHFVYKLEQEEKELQWIKYRQEE